MPETAETPADAILPRRRNNAPPTPTPAIISSQLDGSGAADVGVTSKAIVRDVNDELYAEPS